MYQAITEDAHAAVVAHIKLVNKFVPEYFSSVLNGDKANGLLENAKRYPDKAQELLVRAFESNPYNQDILKRVFLDYPTERLSVLRIAPDFRINLTNEVQQAITDEYSGKAKENWEAAQEAKKNILSLMKAANLTENQTLNQLEHDGLSRLCEKLSPESDEAYCTFLLHQIESFDAQEKIKKEFIDKVQKRIEDIWSAEDGEMFDNLYMGTDLLDEKSIKKAIAFIEEKGRTDSSQKYLDALKKCNRKNLKIARFYQSNKLLVNIAAALGFLLIIAAVFFGKRLGLIGWYRWLVVLVGIVIILITRRITHTWDVLTIKGEAVHEFVKDGIPLDRESKG